MALHGVAAKDDIVHLCRRCAEDPAEILCHLVTYLVEKYGQVSAENPPLPASELGGVMKEGL